MSDPVMWTSVEFPPLSIRLRAGIHLHVTDRADLQMMVMDRATARVFRLSGFGCYILMNLPKQWGSIHDVVICAEQTAGKKFAPEAVQALLDRLYQLGFIEWMGPGNSQAPALQKSSRWQWQLACFNHLGGQSFPILYNVLSMAGWRTIVVLTLAGLGVVISHLPALAASNTMPFNTGKLLLIWCLIFICSTARAFGRAITLQHQGIAVTEIWIGLSPYLLRPYLFTDADQLLWLCSARDRARIVAAGMFAEIWLAVAGFSVWWFVPGNSIFAHLLALLVILSLARLIFRLNPFMRSDGYWLLSHFWDMRQLHSQAISYLKQWRRQQKNGGTLHKQQEWRYILYLVGGMLYSGLLVRLVSSALWARLLYGPPLLRFYTAVIITVLLISFVPSDWKQLPWMRSGHKRES